jgi:hypothetical protein
MPDRDLAVSLYQEGRKLSEIEEETGLSRSSIYDALARAGVTPDRQHARSDLFKAIDDMYGGIDGQPAPLVGYYVRLVHEQERQIGRLEATVEVLEASAMWFRDGWVACLEQQGMDPSVVPPFRR